MHDHLGGDQRDSADRVPCAGTAEKQRDTPQELPAIHGLRVFGESHGRPWPGETDRAQARCPTAPESTSRTGHVLAIFT